MLTSTDSHFRDNSEPDLPGSNPYMVTPTSVSRLTSSFAVTSELIMPDTKLRNINRMSIAYAFQPRLRSRLTLPGRAVCRNPWAYGEGDSHPFYRYSCQHQLLSYLHQCSRSDFTGLDNAPLPREYPRTFASAASVLYFSPVTFSAQHPSTSELLRFL